MADPSIEGMRAAFQRVGSQHGELEAEASDETLQVLSFSLADEWYGFPLADLVEITGGQEPTVIPFTPDFVAGVINHRGSVVPVVDLKHVFGLPTRYHRSGGRIVLVSSESTVVGFRVDAISDVVTVGRSEIEPPLSTIEKVKAEYIEGSVRRSEGLLVLLAARALIHGLKVAPEA